MFAVIFPVFYPLCFVLQQQFVYGFVEKLLPFARANLDAALPAVVNPEALPWACVAAVAFLIWATFAVYAINYSFAKGFDNANPRADSHRASCSYYAAHANCLEGFPQFAAAIACATAL